MRLALGAAGPTAAPGASVQISFVKTPGKRDRVYVRRDDGVEVHWAFPSYGPALPHDLVHLLVETGTGLRRALWGCIADGAALTQINAHADRVGGKTDYVGLLAGDPTQLVQAEALAALPWLTGDLVELRLAWARHRDRFSVDPGPPPAEAVLLRLQESVGATWELWRGLGEEGSLRLEVEVSAGALVLQDGDRP